MTATPALKEKRPGLGRFFHLERRALCSWLLASAQMAKALAANPVAAIGEISLRASCSLFGNDIGL